MNGDRQGNDIFNLAWVTRKTNAQHRKVHGTEPLGSRAYQAVLTETDIPAIRADQRSNYVICKEYGVSAPTIWNVKNGRSWRHVP